MPDTPGVIVNKAVDLDCGQDGGVQVLRDSTNFAGGGNKINSILFVKNIIGKAVAGFEWSTRIWMQNKSAVVGRAEHCAVYIEVDQDGPNNSFGAVVEMRVNDPNSIASVGLELDFWINTHTKDNGSRIMLDCIVAADNRVQHEDVEVGATAAIRTSGGASLSYWSFGAMFRAIRESGVQVTSWIRGGVRGFELLGKWRVGVDLSQASADTAIRLAEGQVLALEQTDQITLRFSQGRTQIRYFGIPMLEVDGSGNLHVKGDIYRNGIKL